MFNMPDVPVKLSPEKKLAIASRLYATARKVKLGALRARYPAWTEAQLQKELNRRFFLMHD